MTDPRFETWIEDLQRRYLADLEFSELVRALKALSSRYVERRAQLTERTALDTAGKRAAYALYYSPLHFLTVRHIVSELSAVNEGLTLLDLGCGAGACGAAWGSLAAREVIGVDSHPWAIGEAPHAYRRFGLKVDVRRSSVARLSLPRTADAIVTGWVVNEVDAPSRAALLKTLIGAASAGVGLLVLEPIATRVAPWWAEWARAFDQVGGRSDEWRFPIQLPDWLARLDRAAGMQHDELTARSIYVAPSNKRAGASNALGKRRGGYR